MDRKKDRLDEKLRQFPKHEMDKDKQDSIHDTLMKTRVSRSKSVFRKRKWVAGFASVAALLLFSVLGLSFFFGDDVNTVNDDRDGKHPNALNAPEKGESHFTAKEEKEQTEHHQATTSHATDDNSDDEVDDNDSDQASSEETDGTDENESETESADPDSDETDDQADETNQDEEDSESDDDGEDVQTIADKTIEALNARDMETIAEYVHPDKGLLFSPYVNIMDDAIVFSKDDVSGMLALDEAFVWGEYDGKGTPIELTPEEYFDEFLDMEPYLQPDDILIDDIQDRGNTLNNIRDVFPEGHIVEYYNEGSEEYEGIDWSSVNLVYEEDSSGDLKLVAIVCDMWTV